MTRRRMISLLFACLFAVLGIAGCGKAVPDYLAYQNEDFSAEVKGTVNGMQFSALISAKMMGDGSGRLLSVSYLGFDPLDGIKIEAYPDGTASLTEDDLTIPSDRASLAGLLSPIELLLTDDEIVSVRKEGELTVVTLPNQINITLSEDDVPVSLSSPAVAFDVVWWEDSGV